MNRGRPLLKQGHGFLAVRALADPHARQGDLPSDEGPWSVAASNPPADIPDAAHDLRFVPSRAAGPRMALSHDRAVDRLDGDGNVLGHFGVEAVEPANPHEHLVF